ncbi:hypothetical protein [Chitinophaga sp. sic0106]|uniref:hypothetical protein n=1 Tax=Chitinophaga sp. sic0106 TaxID=2854785 RepID=UPI001C47229C|nr:hypothetical protein [Chitinophaga sp. sic0106]MBV7530318.1 hypothetical protein [Chitinophaga sp. sic0106]
MRPFITGLLLLCFLSRAAAQDISWPKEIPVSGGGKITIYQPQPENLEGNNLFLRAAVSIRETATSEPIFGVVWADCLLNTDKINRTATLETLSVTRIKIPDITDNTRLMQISGLLEKEVPKWDLTMSLDELLTSIRSEQRIRDNNISTDPPEVIYRTKPSLLVIMDGEPRLQPDKDLNMQRVVNTPNLIVQNPTDKKYYLYGGTFWYASTNVKSGYVVNRNLPAPIRAIDADLKSKEKNDSLPKFNNPLPLDIIVRTSPAELIQTDGAASYKNLQGTSLLYVDNSLEDIFKDINTQLNYILLAGRWYGSASLQGPWKYIPSDELPADFAKIPEGSEKDGVLANVAGTSAAEEAIIDAEIPQTAKVDRSSAQTNVTYDGTPQFQPIEGTNLSLAENSNLTVMQSGNRFYAVDNGVWFTSNSATGPWELSTDRPSDVDRIPATSEAYNTKYVYIYEVTPQYIYTGYTPGYLNCFIYGPTVVWGTGWRYRPWWGPVYYPRPLTWGFGVSYNPWYGWSLGFGWTFNFGWMNFRYWSGGYYGGWFGPPLYRPPFRPWGYNGGYYGRPHWSINRPNINYNRPINQGSRPVRAGNTYPGRPGISNNLYRDRVNIQTADRPSRLPGNSGRPSREPGSTLPGGGNNRVPGGTVPGNSGRPSREPGNTTPGGTVPGNAGRPSREPGNTTPGGNTGRPSRDPGTVTPGSDNNRLPGTTSPGNNTRPSRTPGTNTLPGNNNRIPTRPEARPSRGQNNIMSDGDGNIYRRQNSGWQERQNNGWRAAPQQQQQQMQRMQMQRDRGGMRQQNFSTPPRQAPRAAPSGGGGRPRRG